MMFLKDEMKSMQRNSRCPAQSPARASDHFFDLATGYRALMAMK
ncbi:MAG: hypothetical protein ACOY90_19635 [Candidatus Zhuqueibacterota bacterium]